MSQVIGIDLGTTYSCVAYLQGEEALIIPNLEGNNTTPSVVSFTSSGEQLIGTPALRQAPTNPDKTVYAVKRLMGKKFNSAEIQELQNKLSYKLDKAPNGDVIIDLGGSYITPQEISSLILRYLRKCAEDYFCLLYTSPSPRDLSTSRMPSSA